jgi:cytochrome c oxidase cbb3-type subunit 3
VSEFTSAFWPVSIAAITVVSIVACGVLLWKLSTRRLPAGRKADLMGHVWDENLEEYNNPLPRWWIWLFWITLVFGLAYVILYPGLGGFAGVLKWSSSGQYDREIARAQDRYGPLFARYAAQPIEQVAAEAQAREMGQRVFLNHCAQCHASDGRGGHGFPNLADNEWQFGGAPEQIVQTIAQGRQGIMPPWPQLGGEGVKNVAHYVLALAGRTHDGLRAAEGKRLFEQNCVACHGAEGKGNPALGAPNLTDEVWLYGGGESTVIETLTKGRNGVMPAWGEFLGPDKVHLVAAYVYSLSHPRGN